VVKATSNLTVALTLITLAICLPAIAKHDHDDQYMPPPVPSAQPGERILIMRHAEKPDDDDNPNLTPAGYRRAANLATYIPEKYGRPDFIFAASTSKNSARPFETLVPLSQKTGVPIDTEFKDKDYDRLAYVLTHDNRFANKLVVVAWHHGKIPELTQSLNAPPSPTLLHWGDNVYNQIIQLDYINGLMPIVQKSQEPF
jgi:phosphohistidine phosphatase SixA